MRSRIPSHPAHPIRCGVNNSAYSGLLTDRYELTMLSAALRDGTAHRRATFELFARKLPDERQYGVMAATGRFLEALPEFSSDDDPATHWRSSSTATP